MGLFRLQRDDMVEFRWDTWSAVLASRLDGYVFLLYPAAAEMDAGLQGTNLERQLQWTTLSQKDDTSPALAVSLHVQDGGLIVNEWFMVQHMEVVGSYRVLFNNEQAGSDDFKAGQQSPINLALKEDYCTYMYQFSVLNTENKEVWVNPPLVAPGYAILDAADINSPKPVPLEPTPSPIGSAKRVSRAKDVGQNKARGLGNVGTPTAGLKRLVAAVGQLEEGDSSHQLNVTELQAAMVLLKNATNVGFHDITNLIEERLPLYNETPVGQASAEQVAAPVTTLAPPGTTLAAHQGGGAEQAEVSTPK
eukprot:gene14368-20369_t